MSSRVVDPQIIAILCKNCRGCINNWQENKCDRKPPLVSSVWGKWARLYPRGHWRWACHLSGGCWRGSRTQLCLWTTCCLEKAVHLWTTAITSDQGLLDKRMRTFFSLCSHTNWTHSKTEYPQLDVLSASSTFQPSYYRIISQFVPEDLPSLRFSRDELRPLSNSLSRSLLCR